MSIPISITVKDMKSTEKILKIIKSNTIAEGKSKLGHELGRVWKYEGNILDNNKKFEDYEIDEGDTIIEINKIIGG